jgi:hypothetical protein
MSSAGCGLPGWWKKQTYLTALASPSRAGAKRVKIVRKVKARQIVLRANMHLIATAGNVGHVKHAPAVNIAGMPSRRAWLIAAQIYDALL